MKFEKAYTSREHRYPLGLETTSGRLYAANLVSNQMLDHIVYHAVGDDECRTFLADESRAIEFADSCRRREQDERQVYPPSSCN